MYLHIDVVAAAERTALLAVRADRERYRPFLEAAERFASRAGLIVCGSAALPMLTGGAEPLDYKYDFYSSRGFALARELADVIYDADPDGLGHYTTLTTNIPHHNWKIIVDGRPMFTITTVSSQLRSSCSIQRPALYDPTIKIPVIKQELALIDLYRDICDPTRLEDIKELLAAEAKLRGEFVKKLARVPNRPKHRQHPRPIAEFQARLLKEFVTGPGRVLIGAAALPGAAMTGPLQLVSSEEFDIEAETVAVIGRSLGLTVAARAAEMHIPSDTRLRRLTLSVVGPHHQEAILEIYNTAAYELVPFVAGSLRVGSPFVILRFLLIDIWQAHQSSAHGEGALYLYTEAVKLLDGPPERVLPIEYTGRAEDAEVAFKREVQSAMTKLGADGKQRFFSVYMPAAGKKSDPTIKAALSRSGTALSKIGLNSAPVDEFEHILGDEFEHILGDEFELVPEDEFEFFPAEEP
jgi:hypothetical protein